MPEVALISASLLDASNPDKLDIGGVATVTASVARALRGAGIDVEILQLAPASFEGTLDGEIPVHGQSLDEILTFFRGNPRCVSFLTDHSVFAKTVPQYDLFYQHGVYWDGFQRERFSNPLLQKLYLFKSRLRRRRNLRNLQKLVHRCYQIVTVDTNFQNWYRGLYPADPIDVKCSYVPNCAILPPVERTQPKWDSPQRFRLIFARRFVNARGSVLWARVAGKLLDERDDVEFVFAGSGPDQPRMQEFCPPGERALYKEFTQRDLQDELLACHISVVPTIYAEGTSCSLLESMAAGCACVTTPVGGLCDIVQHDRNALFAKPTVESFAQRVESLLDAPDEAKRIASAGRCSVEESFNHDLWTQRILAIVTEEIARKASMPSLTK